MKRLSLYKIESESFPMMYIAARSDRQAAEIYVTWEAAQGRRRDSFTVELVRFATLDESQQAQLQALLATRSEGIVHFSDEAGWSIDSDGWTSFDPNGEDQT